MEQHPVPQHIASFEFKLFGNLTVRQFVTLSIPMSLAAAIYFSGLPVIIRLPLALIVGLFALFAALVPIGGRPFDKWVVAFIKAITSPTQRIWVKESKIPQFLSVVTAPSPTEEHIPESITAQGRARLRDYLRSLPKGEVTPLDVKEQIAVQRLDLESISEGLPQGKLPPPIIWPTSRPFAQTSLPQINAAPKVTTAQIQATEESFQGELEAALPPIKPVETHRQATIAHHAKPFALPGLERKIKEEESPLVQLAPTPPLVRAKLASESNATIESVIPIRTPDRQIKLIHGIGKTRARKLHFAPPIGFDLSKLPIRGEKRFEISEELKKRYGTADDLFVEPQPTGITPGVSQVAPSHTQSKFVPRTTKSVTLPQNVSLKTQQESETDSKITIHGEKPKNQPLEASLARAQMVPLTTKPNVLSGIVTNSSKEPIENVILTVRDASGIPIRAFKTNKLGQFLSATPLPDGSYTIEMESEFYQFDPLSLHLTGQVLTPIEITAKGGA